MKQSLFTIESNENIARGAYRLVLLGDGSAVTSPGQFVNIRLDGRFLRRPLSVCDAKEGRITLVYKTVGEGTRQLSAMRAGEKLDILTGLGNGFDLSAAGERPLLIGGGAGAAPLFALAKALRAMGKDCAVILGFNSAEEVLLEKEFLALGCTVTVSTMDGSHGVKGLATDALSFCGDYSYYYCCGPLPMMEAVYKLAAGGGEFSFEERMGCGFGACMGCSHKTAEGVKRICKDGPVLKKEEIIWQIHG